MRRTLHMLMNWFFRLKDLVFRKSDPVLLLFLLLVTNYRFSFKIIAIIGIYAYRPNFKFERSGIIYFYASVILLSLFNLFFISGDLAYNHLIIVGTGCLIWLACLLVFHQLNLSIKANSVFQTIHTIKLLTVINAVASVIDLLKIIAVTHAFNPYNQVSPPPYGISSGDLVGGVFGDMHLVNMTICAMLLIFFLYQRSFLFSLLALLPLLLTGSNLGTLITLGALLYLLLKKDLIRSYYVLFCMAIVLVFYVKITPKNFDYLMATFDKVGRQIRQEPPKVLPPNNSTVVKKTAEELKKEKIYLYLSQQSSHKAPEAATDSVYELKQAKVLKDKSRQQGRTIYTLHVKDSLQQAKEHDPRFEFGKLKKFDFTRQSGKMISFEQTRDFLLSDWRNFFFGAGLGSFSSRLAFIGSEIISDSRILMAMPKYESRAFAENHKAIFLYLMFLDDEHHSITNLPFCWYNEALGEYGLVGFLVFILFYLGFFVKRMRLMTFGRILLALILLFFLFDYWYQRISVMVLFELLMLLNFKIISEKLQAGHDET